MSLLLISASYASVRGLAGHVEEYSELGEEVDRLAEEVGDPGLRMATMGVAIYSRYVRGRLGEALALTEEAIALGAADPTLGGGPALVCPYAWCVMMRGTILAHHGLRGGVGGGARARFANRSRAGRRRDRRVGARRRCHAGAISQADRHGARARDPTPTRSASVSVTPSRADGTSSGWDTPV